MSSQVDVAIVGAGAAGLGAALALRSSGLDVLVLEARERVGGRGHTLAPAPGLVLDLGCGWLHSACRNPWTGIAEDLGLTVDRSPPPWSRPALNLPEAEARAFGRVFESFEARLEAAAAGPDAPASSLMRPEEARWRPRLDAFSGYYNGAPFDEISIHDYAAYAPDPENWRVREGYGALMQRAAQGLPIVFERPVRRIERGGRRLRLVTDAGPLEAAFVIVCVPTTVIAEGGLAFDPDLPDIVEAAAALPLGDVDKAFLRLARPDAFEPDTRVVARTDTADTGAYSLRPLGMPIVEAFFGGRLAAALEAEGPGAFARFAREELAGVLGAEFARGLEPLAESRWSADPFSRGAYSHARPGMAHMRARLADSGDARIVFAGEACSAHDFSTAHGAHETGAAAAERVAARAQPTRRPAAGLTRLPPP